MLILIRTLFLFSFIFFCSTLLFWGEDNKDEQLTALGVQLEEEEEIADRDSDVPTLYDRNKITLMHQRDRWLRRHGRCQPPPDVLVSPQIIQVPPTDEGCFEVNDPRNPIYRSYR